MLIMLTNPQSATIHTKPALIHNDLIFLLEYIFEKTSFSAILNLFNISCRKFINMAYIFTNMSNLTYDQIAHEVGNSEDESEDAAEISRATISKYVQYFKVSRSQKFFQVQANIQCVLADIMSGISATKAWQEKMYTYIIFSVYCF